MPSRPGRHAFIRTGHVRIQVAVTRALARVGSLTTVGGIKVELFRHFAQWIGSTAFCEWLGENAWVIPISQSLHIVCLAVVFGSATVISLHLLGITKPGRSTSQTVTTLVPWMYRALVVLLLTGALQTIAEPVRQLVTPEFVWKMVLIIGILAMTIIFSRSVRANPAAWDSPATRPRAAGSFAVVSLVLWTTIVVLGRLIGYTWAFYA
jgi:hypothetical protein